MSQLKCHLETRNTSKVLMKFSQFALNEENLSLNQIITCSSICNKILVSLMHLISIFLVLKKKWAWKKWTRVLKLRYSSDLHLFPQVFPIFIVYLWPFFCDSWRSVTRRYRRCVHNDTWLRIVMILVTLKITTFNHGHAT